MISMAKLGKIREMYFQDGKSISQIARLTSLSRNPSTGDVGFA